MITLYAAFTTTVRVIDRIHSHTAVGRTLAQPASFAGLTVSNVLVIEVADLADGRHTIEAELANFTAWQLDQGDIAFFAEQLRRIARRTYQLSATAGIQLQVMERRAGRNQFNRQRIAGQNVGAFAGQDGRRP